MKKMKSSEQLRKIKLVSWNWPTRILIYGIHICKCWATFQGKKASPMQDQGVYTFVSLPLIKGSNVSSILPS